MAAIKIDDLGAPGSILFNDSETYLNDLVEDELGVVGGMMKASSSGITLPCTPTIGSWSVSWTYSVV
jgi:hypothetical protein